MSASPLPLSPAEIALFQALSNSGLVYLLMLRLKRPLGAREIADTLGIHEQTAARYLRRLARLNLVARSGRNQGYVLLAGNQLILGEVDPPRAGEITAASPDCAENPRKGTEDKLGDGNRVENPHAPTVSNPQNRADVPEDTAADTAHFSQVPTDITAQTTKKTQYPVNNNV